MKETKKVFIGICIFIGISFTPLSVVPVYATPNEYEEYETLENKRKVLDKEMKEIEKKLANLLEKISDDEEELIELENTINLASNQIENIEVEIDENENILSHRLREIYKSNGQTSYILILFNAKNLNDLLRRFNSINRIVSLDRQLIESLSLTKEHFTTNIKKAQERIDEINIKNEPIKREIGELNNEKNAKSVELDEILKQQQKLVASFGVMATGDALTVLNEAYKHLGKPYVWGAKGPNTFDCSGFTSYVYRHSIGIEIGVSTYVQIKSGREVSYSELQPGDLVFPHLGHVGIYIGNGQMIHAPRTGDVVKVAPVYKFWRGRRILE